MMTRLPTGDRPKTRLWDEVVHYTPLAQMLEKSIQIDEAVLPYSRQLHFALTEPSRNYNDVLQTLTGGRKDCHSVKTALT